MILQTRVLDMPITETVITKQLGHLGLIAAVVKKLKIVEKIDRRLPVSKEHGAIVTMGQRVSAMILNGLGFLNDRLYLHSMFFEDKPIEHLLGEGITADNLNDDALGRALDAIYDYGTTKLFSELAFEIANEHNLLGKTARLDTTTISLQGDYDEDESERAKGSIDVTYGHAKNKRFDLKQVILSLTNSGKSGHPLWMEALSGNTSDKTSFQETVRKFVAFKQQLENAPDLIYTADSALYTTDKLLSAINLRWITRVPESIKEARLLVEKDAGDFIWQLLTKGYQYSEAISNHGGVPQRWQVIYSEQAFIREQKTLIKKIAKKQEELKKLLWHLNNKVFACEADANMAIKPILKVLKYHQITYAVTAITKHKGKGRPKADETPEIAGYQIEGTIFADDNAIKKATNRLGRFILATNELDQNILPSDSILNNYKELDKVEKGFRFIKSKEFSISSIYLKTPARIEALMMVMTLCLMVYNFGEQAFRTSLEASDDTIPDQVGKKTKKPTMRWVFRILNKISIAYFNIDGTKKAVVANVCAVCKKIIRHFGVDAMSIYGMI